MAWVGAVSSLPCAGWGVGGKSVLGWWAGKGVTACQIFKLFFIYIYINATVLFWSIKDPLEIHSRGLP